MKFLRTLLVTVVLSGPGCAIEIEVEPVRVGDGAVEGFPDTGSVDALRPLDSSLPMDSEPDGDPELDAGGPPDAHDADAGVPHDANQGLADVGRDAASIEADFSLGVDAGPLDQSVLEAGLGQDGGGVDGLAVPAPTVDLELLRDSLTEDLWLDEKFFGPDDCAVVEGCITEPGLRRLVRFSVATANVGDEDLILGVAEDNPDRFEYSACHNHYHFEGYASYALSIGGMIAAEGHKQAFCLMDVGRHLDDETVRGAARYTCRFQGISRGWQDTYGSHLDCQWVDVTGLEAGLYDLTVEINRERNLEEMSYDNNLATVPVRITDFRIDAPCEGGEVAGLRRSCGWTMREVAECEPGDVVEVSCGGCNGDGEACLGNPMMRVCDGAMTQCFRSLALSESDDTCETRCPENRFLCPESRQFTIWTASHHGDGNATCNYAIRRAPPVLVEPCVGDELNGPERMCGWRAALPAEPCLPGFEYRLGCSRDMHGACVAEDRCDGDPMLRVCAGKTTCLSHSSLAQNDDACGGQCSEVSFECPLQGQITAFTASYQTGNEFACELVLERIGQ